MGQGGIKECGLQNHCNSHLITGKNCDCPLWKRSKQEKICAYGPFWKTWVLGEYISKLN